MRTPTTLTMRLALVVLGALAAISMVACSSSEAKRQTVGEQQRLDRPNDETITRWAEDALSTDPRVSSADIKVRTLNGIVKLSGTTDSIQAKRYAKLEVDKIDGVQGIIDELVIRPAARPADQVQEDVVRRLNDSPGVRSSDLVVSVKDGVVTLHGKVPSWNELDYASTLAGEVRGVREVVNDMELSFAQPRSDDQNRDEIVAALDRDPYLTGLPITVSVSGDTATLQGTVGSAYEKDRAEIDALRAASISVVKNSVTVDWWKDRGVRENRPAPTDTQIKQAVREALNQDLRIMQPEDIKIEVSDREVTLEGSAQDYYQETIARQDAHDAVGAEKVVDLIDVAAFDRDDNAIARDLRLDLGADYALADRSIDVSVADGVATLTGDVRNSFEKQHAEDVAGSVLGVRAVVNDVVVRPAVGYSDAALKQRIESRLAANWKTRRDAPRIQVAVEDGSATLTGVVDTWSERLEAGRVARLVNGVSDVTNDLAISDLEFPAISRLNGEKSNSEQ